MWYECVVLLLCHDGPGAETFGLILNKPPTTATEGDGGLAARSRPGNVTYESGYGGSAPWGDFAVFGVVRTRREAESIVSGASGGRVLRLADDLFVACLAAVPPAPRRRSRFFPWRKTKEPPSEATAGEERATPVANRDVDVRVCHLTSDWGYMQLDDECSAGHWRIVPYQADVVFASRRDMWARLQ